MNLFKRKRCSQELITIKDGNLVFNLNNQDINIVYYTLQAVMKKSGIFNENLYFDLYREYKKHYVIYDVVPSLLQYKVSLIFSGRFPGILFDNQFTFEELVPNACVYHKLSNKFKLPENLEKTLLEVKNRVSAYLDTWDISDNVYRDLIRMNFVKQWDVFKRHPELIDIYMENQLGILVSCASPENKTIVKNIIERTLEDLNGLAQEFLTKSYSHE
jgi:hypothetical protein